MMSSAKSTAFKYKTLNILVSGLEGKNIIVEMKNDSEIEGRLESSDGFMNLQMKNGTFTFADGKKSKFSDMKVRGSSIRFVQLPSDINPVSVIRQQLSQKRNSLEKKNFKAS